MLKQYASAVLLSFIILCILLPYSTVSATDDAETERKLSMEEAVHMANKELGFTYYATSALVKINGIYKKMELNRRIWDAREILVYGGPDIVPSSEQDEDKIKTDKGRYRYLGYTIDGDLIPDPDYREDHISTTLINNYNWRSWPWRVEYGGAGQNIFDNKLENLPYPERCRDIQE